jgi:hypothetical protein
MAINRPPQRRRSSQRKLGGADLGGFGVGTTGNTELGGSGDRSSDMPGYGRTDGSNRTFLGVAAADAALSNLHIALGGVPPPRTTFIPVPPGPGRRANWFAPGGTPGTPAADYVNFPSQMALQGRAGYTGPFGPNAPQPTGPWGTRPYNPGGRAKPGGSAAPVFPNAAAANRIFQRGLRNLAAGNPLPPRQQLAVGAAYNNATQTAAQRAAMRRTLLGGMTDDRHATPAELARVRALAQAAQQAALVASGNRVLVRNLNTGGAAIIRANQMPAYQQRAATQAAARQVATLNSAQTARVLANAVARRQSGRPLSPQQIAAMRASTAAQRAAAR